MVVDVTCSVTRSGWNGGWYSRWKYVIALYCCVAVSVALAEQPIAEEDPVVVDSLAPPVALDDEPLPYWKKSAYWLEDSRNNWSERVDWLARGMDRFFAGKETLDFSNKSYMRLRAGGSWVEGGQYLDDSDIKFRLHLPATEKRFSIIIESESENKETLEDKARPSVSQDNNFDNSRVTAALEFARTQAKLWKTRTLLGVKAQIPGDIFLKFSAKRRWELNDEWTMPYKFKIAHYVVDGLEVETSLAFERPLEHELFFSATTGFEWSEEDDVTHGAQIFSLKKRLDEKSGVNYSLGILGKDAAKPRMTSYFLSAHYRALLYKDWLYWNVIPEVNFPREDDFASEFSLTVRFEVFFQK